MFNFLRGEHREKIIKEYRKRLYAVSGGFAVLSLLVLIGAITPAFLSLRSEREVLMMKREALSREAAADGQVEIENRVADMEKMLSVLKQDRDRETLVSIMENVFSNKGGGISLSAVSLERKKDFWVVSFSGVAATRETLVDFSKRLGMVPSFSAVDLPVASLAKNNNIPFNISLKSAFAKKP